MVSEGARKEAESRTTEDKGQGSIFFLEYHRIIISPCIILYPKASKHCAV